MADFRKWILALVALGLLLGVSSSTALAQGTNCTLAPVPETLRAEGITELLGDLILICSSTSPSTQGGVAIPQVNVQVSINTNLTSRIVSAIGNVSEALLMIDEPYPGNATQNPASPPAALPGTSQPTTQLACLANNNTNCAIISHGQGQTGSAAASNYSGLSDVSGKHYNIFQGVQSGVNSISWNGVPIDPPGTNGTRIIRITNIRANAFQLGVSSTLVPTQINETITVSPPQNLTINQTASATAVVGQVLPGLLQPPSIKVGVIPGAAAYSQCNSVNTYLLTPPLSSVPTDTGIAVTATEGFSSSFKPQNYNQLSTVNAGGANYVAPGGALVLQNVPGFDYATESGFTPSNALAVGLVEPASGTEAVGYADTGTELQFTVSGVGAGVSLYAPSYVYLSGSYGTGTAIGVAVLQGQAAAIGGAFGGGGAAGIPVVLAPATGTNGASTLISVSGTTATLVYQIYYANASVTESLTVPISVEYVSNTGSNIPAATTTPATVGLEFYPQSTVTTASAGPVPRFGPSGSPQNLFSISPCSCDLLFPFVTNIAGFDTGVAIANTSTDPFGTSPQTGTVTLNYYGTTPGGGAAPPKAVTTSNVSGGQELIFTLSNGGNFGIPATPGFEGYIISQANFQYCHGFAFISDVGAQKLAEGYLAINIDAGGLTRPALAGNLSENKAH